MSGDELQRDRESSALLLCYFLFSQGGPFQMPVMQQRGIRASVPDHARRLGLSDPLVSL